MVLTFDLLRLAPGLKKKANYILDLRGTIPPITLLKISQVFREMSHGEILEIFCRDLDTRRDVFKVLPPFSYDLIMMEEMKDESEYIRVQMRKK